MVTRLNKLETENKNLKQKLADQETYSRRSNLIITGIPENRGQNLFAWFRNFSRYDLNLPREIPIERIHRMGPLPQSEFQRPRPIIIRFSNFQDRQLVWNNRRQRNFRNPHRKFFISEDLPQDIVEARRRLMPIAHEANALHMRATVRSDKLIVEGNSYDIASLDKLPPSLIPISKSYRETINQISFFRKYCPLSNHSPAPFTINKKDYNSSEQMFLSEKCITFGQTAAAQNIMCMDDPGKMVQEAKVCRGYNEKWDMEQEDIMLTAILGKFTQNEEHEKFLLSTGDKILVEGSPYDSTWGVGLAFNDPAIDNSQNWKGDNLLGKALMTARRLIKPNPKQHLSGQSNETHEHPDTPTMIAATQSFVVNSPTMIAATQSFVVNSELF